MLKKVMKYEFRAMGRQFLPAYIAVIALAILNGLFLWAGDTSAPAAALARPGAVATSVLFGAFYGMVVFGTLVLTMVLIIRRFYVSLFKDEGYLTNTLPVSADTLIFGKLIAAVCWSIISIIVVSVSFLLVSMPWFVWQDLLDFFIWEHGLLWLASMFVSLVTGILAFYSALAIGQLAKRRKILLAIGAYMGISFVVSVISTVFMLNSGSWWNSIFFGIGGAWTNMMLFGMGFSLAQAVMHYMITRYILKNKLNLE